MRWRCRDCHQRLSAAWYVRLALPAGVEVDEKVLLHERLHLEYHDISWGIVICFFRCIHWCNPLIWYCADRAGNDLETLCDQRVLERLEGEERRRGNVGWRHQQTLAGSAEAVDFTLLLRLQNSVFVDSYVPNNWSFLTFDSTPQPDADFSDANSTIALLALYTGSPEDIGNYSNISGTLYMPESEPVRFGRDLEDSTIFLYSDFRNHTLLDSFSAELRLNAMPAKELTPLPVEGGDNGKT